MFQVGACCGNAGRRVEDCGSNPAGCRRLVGSNVAGTGITPSFHAGGAVRWGGLTGSGLILMMDCMPTGSGILVSTGCSRCPGAERCSEEIIADGIECREIPCRSQWIAENLVDALKAAINTCARCHFYRPGIGHSLTEEESADDGASQTGVFLKEFLRGGVAQFVGDELKCR